MNNLKFITLFSAVLMIIASCNVQNHVDLVFNFVALPGEEVTLHTRQQTLEIVRQRMIMAGFDKASFTTDLQRNRLVVSLHQAENFSQSFVQKIRLLITTPGHISIRETYNNTDLTIKIAEINKYLREYQQLENGLYSIISAPVFRDADNEIIEYSGPILGYSYPSQMFKLKEVFSNETILNLLPDDFFLMPAVPVLDSLHPLIMIKTRYSNHDMELIRGNDFEEAVILFEEDYSELQIQLKRNPSIRFQELTFENIGRHLAIEMDGLVLVYPRLESPIDDGYIAIPGVHVHPAFELLVITSLSGKLPATLIPE